MILDLFRHPDDTSSHWKLRPGGKWWSATAGGIAWRLFLRIDSAERVYWTLHSDSLGGYQSSHSTSRHAALRLLSVCRRTYTAAWEVPQEEVTARLEYLHPTRYLSGTP